VLAEPLRREVGEASNAHAIGEPAIDGRFDQIRRARATGAGRLSLPNELA
jgi:hypothetical protein